MMREYVEKAMTFAEYIKLIDDLLLDGKTTGPTQSEAMFGYGKLNRQRMHRLEKTVVLTDSIKIAANDVDRKMVWLIITEGWCGDAAQFNEILGLTDYSAVVLATVGYRDAQNDWLAPLPKVRKPLDELIVRR